MTAPFNEADHPRTATGEFTNKPHSAPEVGLGLAPSGTALAELERAIAGEGQAALDEAREHMSGSYWRPSVYFVDYNERLDSTLGAYIEGDDDAVTDMLASFDDGEALTEAGREIFPTTWDELSEESQDEVRSWLSEWDDSDVIGALARNTPPQLMQFPVVDDGDLEAALLAASAHHEASQERYGAMEDALMGAVTGAGGEDNEANREAVRTLIDETDLASEFVPGTWKLRVIAYDDIDNAAMSLFSAHGKSARELTMDNASLLLIDPHSGRGMDAQLSGPITSRITPERPAILDDAAPGYGSWDAVAGVHKPAYRVSTVVRVLEDTTQGTP